MRIHNNIIAISFICLLQLVCENSLNAAIISGKATDKNRENLQYVSIYIKGTSRGTTSNSEGYYSIELPKGSYELVFRMIGYKTLNQSIVVTQANINLDVSLEYEAFQLNEVKIIGGEDIAYEMIRKAIKKRKYYLEQVDAYSCDAYVKGIEYMNTHPKKLLGHTISNDDLDLIDSSKIIYLSESVSKLNFKQSHQIKEEIISSRVSGDSKSFTFNNASEFLSFNFYKNLIEVKGLSERGFISPIANNALFYYNYKFISTFKENGQTINKIEVIPKRKHDPVFRGFIYLEESGWRINSTDLYISKDAQINFVDTLLFQQSFIPLDSNVWMPFSNKMLLVGGLLGFRFKGVFIGVNSNYTINPDFPKKFFNGETLKVNENSNKKDSIYWKNIRPISLTNEEKKDYVRRDSVMTIKKSKTYLDSSDKVRNKFKISDFILSGYSYTNSYEKASYYLASLLSMFEFNPIQGLLVKSSLEYHKDLEKNRFISLTPFASYGFSNHKWYGGISTYHFYNAEKDGSISFNAGIDARQFSQFQEIIPIINTFYSLLDKKNYLKLYESKYIKARNLIELINGVYLTTGIEYEIRNYLHNTTDYSLIKRAYNYTTNEMTNGITSYSQNPNRALIFNTGLTFLLGQKYETRPNQKNITKNGNPKLNIYYKKGINGLSISDVNYDYISTSLSGNFNLKIFGNSAWAISTGKFINNNKMDFMDYHHFIGDKTFITFLSDNSFELLDYYKYSTNVQFLQANFEHNFGGLILNKIPLLRKAKFGEIAGVRYLSTNTLPQYVELYAGIEKLRLFRFSFVTAFNQNQHLTSGFRLGLRFSL